MNRKASGRRGCHTFGAPTVTLFERRGQTGLVTLRVLDANKNEIRLLYVGLLKPGQWRFQWDGKQEKGGWVPPGNYQIQVLSGAITLTKQIAIRSETDLTQNH